MAISAKLVNPGSRNFPLISAYVFFAILSGIELLGKLDLIADLTHIPRAIVTAVVLVSILAPLSSSLLMRFASLFGPLTFIGLIVCFLVVFPRVQDLHHIGRGSDQADSIIVTGASLLKGEWPYQRDKLWTHNPPSAGPGWVALHAPFVRAFGYGATLGIFWTAFLAAFVRQKGWRRANEYMTLLGFCPGVWLAASNGSDWLTFGGAVVSIFILSTADKAGGVAISVLNGLICQFRVTTLILPLLANRGRIGTFGLLSFFIGIFCYAGFLVWNFTGFVADGPIAIFEKAFGFSLMVLPRITFLLATLAVIAATIVTAMVVARSWGGVGATVVYLAITTTVPAILNLQQHVTSQGFIAGLGTWEGCMWLLGFIPLLALLLINDFANGNEAAAARVI